MASTYTLINTFTVTSATTPISFTNISQNYTDLLLRVTSRTTRSNPVGFLYFQFPSSVAEYYEKYINSDGTTLSGGSATANDAFGGSGVIYTNASTSTPNSQGITEVYIPNYTIGTASAPNYKNIVITSMQTPTITTMYSSVIQGFYGNYGAITSINVGSTVGNIDVGTKIDIYGVWKGTGTTLPSTPTIGTATATSATTATVAFTPTSATGVDASYTALSTPGSITATGNSSPISVTGLTGGTAYTFQVKANNPGGSSGYSSASNSVTPNTSFQSIATAIGTGSSGTITFSSIPSTYKHLQIRCNMVVANANQTPNITFNGDTASNYTNHIGYAYGTGSGFAKAGYANAGRANIIIAGVGWGTVTTYPNVAIIDIHNYSATDQYKTLTAFGGMDNGIANQGEVDMTSGMWQSTSAITSITITGVSTFTTNTSIALYGIMG